MSLLQRPTLLVVNYSNPVTALHVIGFGSNFKLAQCLVGTFG